MAQLIHPTKGLFSTFRVCSMDLLELIQAGIVLTKGVVIQWYATLLCMLFDVKSIHQKLHMLKEVLSKHNVLPGQIL